MVVIRESVLKDALHRLQKPLFDPAKRLKVSSVFAVPTCNKEFIHRWNLLPKKGQTPAALLGNSSL